VNQSNENSPTIQKKNNNHLRVRIILLLSGGFILILLIIGIKYGWFSNWHTLENPPDRVVKIIAIKGDSIWVKVSSGKIYFNENSYQCQKDCWVITTETPSEQFLQQDEYGFKRLGIHCSQPPPLFLVADSMAECRSEYMSVVDSIYVLRFDGSLVSWYFVYGEYYQMFDCFYVCAILVIMIFLSFIIDKLVGIPKPSVISKDN